MKLTIPNLRLSHPADADTIKTAFLQSKSYRSVRPENTEKTTVNLLIDNVDYLVEQIVSRQVEAVIINENYLLVYSVCKPWYSKDQWVLHEDLVLRIGKGGSFADVVTTLDLIAQEEDVSAIIVGGALAHSSRALIRMYSQYGFVPETSNPSLTKLRR